MGANRGVRGMNRMLKPVKNRVANMVARAVVKLVTEATKLQSVQLEIQDNEIRGNVERFQQYGFSSKPLAGAEAVVVFVGGGRDHALVTNVDDRRYRPKFLVDGEAVVYNHQGDYVHVKADGTIKVVAATRVDIECPLVRMSGDLEVKGDITDRYEEQNGTIHGMRTIYNHHTHNETQTVTNEPNQQMYE